MQVCSAKCTMRKCAVIIICDQMLIHHSNRYLIFLIMKCGQVRHRCVLMTVYLIVGGGVHLWNMAMASSAICVFICSMLYDGCRILVGPKIFHPTEVFM